MKEKINKENENYKANITITTNIIFFLIVVLKGFLYTKILILRYGDEISGFISFYSSIYQYILIAGSAVFIAVLNRMILLYKSGKKDEVKFLLIWVEKITKWFAIIFLAISLTSSVIFSYAFFHYFYISIFLLSFSGSLVIFFYYFFNMKYELYYTSVNKKFKYSIISSVTLMISAIISTFILFYPNNIVLDKILSNGVIVRAIAGNYKYLYFVIVGSQMIPVIGTIISYFIFKFNSKEDIFKIKNIERIESKKYILKIKKELKKSLLQSLIVSLSTMIIFDGDSFIMSILKVNNPSGFILQKITIASLYSSVITSFSLLINSYSQSRNVIVGIGDLNDENYQREIIATKRKNLFISLFSYPLVMIFSLIIIPVYFGGNNNVYYDSEFALPISLTFILYSILTIQDYEIQLHDSIKVVSRINFIAAIFNIVLALSFVLLVGVYWVFWVNFISLLIKTLFYIRYILKNRKDGYRSVFSFLFLKKNKKNAFIFLLLLIWSIGIFTFTFFGHDFLKVAISSLVNDFSGYKYKNLILYSTVILSTLVISLFIYKKKLFIETNKIRKNNIIN
ncbi:MAG: hypothetical protein NC236_00370 [Mycoplasma sp.]|nr:hypothetical protein [Mycoplasma sp.]